MKRNTSNWSNFGMLLRRAGLTASAGLSCYYTSAECWCHKHPSVNYNIIWYKTCSRMHQTATFRRRTCQNFSGETPPALGREICLLPRPHSRCRRFRSADCRSSPNQISGYGQRHWQRDQANQMLNSPIVSYRIVWSRDRWRYPSLTGQGHDPFTGL